MMNHTLKNLCNLPLGTVVTGKWHRHSYKLVKPLGNGANGVVYLAESTKGLVALKLSDNSAAIASEVNVLRRFSKVQGVALGPSLLDVDDWVNPLMNKTIPFYVMEYIKGENFFTFIRKRGKEWAVVLLLQLLSALDQLHQEGWVFGDLKPENLLVAGPPPTVRLLDVGGTTLQGRAVKEFTEFYDRGYWGVGSRKAEPSYDLFAVAMIMIQACYPIKFERKGDGRRQLISIIQADDTLRTYQTVLMKAIDGKYKRASEMKQDFLTALQRSYHSHSNQRTFQRTMQKTRRNKKRKRSKTKGVLETALIVAVLLCAYAIYVYHQVLP
ncbi:protein kinase family protein [Geobacillus sp. NFOSA3]|uniref:Serine/threonine-protein kinase n=2 Tax=Anoxybacillaceae TaxID=3120669 RepID=A0A6G9J288_9BACL|nr:serine/threonine-protein kinase [Parageobacillus toebii]NNU93865.1 protein kinase family protein [Geobacillus sp. NFOSA3]MBB3870196.1 serine/threonine-protein kinase [Parageobacillus toebii NBRC 107807]QIQ32292.1 serine/threonine protein kinase [Parageobacillus toebii NBRC 107807]QSB49138.1 serine/threonine protein kinase [Parageobacillus toebii]WMT20142.1 serine/threonine-protein kinase [Parageobacillus toebii]